MACEDPGDIAVSLGSTPCLVALLVREVDWSLVVLHAGATMLAYYVMEFAPFSMCLVIAGNVFFMLKELWG